MVETEEREGESLFAPDYTSIDSEVLTTYTLPPEMAGGDIPPITAIGDQGLSALTPREAAILPEREYVVDVEYSSESSALRTQSLKRYYNTFEEARITQEAIAQLIHQHLSVALNSGDVFVEVKSGTGKRVRTGSVL